MKACFVDCDPTLTAHIIGQIEWEAIGIVQFEGNFAGEFLVLSAGSICAGSAAVT